MVNLDPALVALAGGENEVGPTLEWVMGYCGKEAVSGLAGKASLPGPARDAVAVDLDEEVREQLLLRCDDPALLDKAANILMMVAVALGGRE